MGRRVLTFSLLTLLVIGILLTLLTNPLSILIPVVVIGGIFLLARRQSGYRRSPFRSNLWSRNTTSSARKAEGIQSPINWFRKSSPEVRKEQHGKKRQRKKKHSFQVIDGHKGKKSPNDEPDQHQYH